MRFASFLFAILGLVGFGANAQQEVRQQASFRLVFSGTLTTTSTLLIPENNARKYLLMVNDCAETVYAKPYSVQNGLEGVAIPSGGNWEPYVVPTNGFYLRSTSLNSNCRLTVVEGIY